ncbi:uncharacterized protein LOC127835832 [Dreissena polymorpha]|uniref:uncharacterized protein LOC127835832 n=1 Tax=Dreissena polymorpha TaxID=45954 RepID=UPI0022643182|nr:uncharacterized protein LOC127835832 [Dreissena polymorpha]
MSILRVQASDFGRYRVTVYNELGEIDEEFTIHAPDENEEEHKSIDVVVASTISIGVVSVVAAVVVVVLIKRNQLDASTKIHKCLWWLRCRESSSRCSYFENIDSHCDREVNYEYLIEYKRRYEATNASYEKCAIESAPENKYEALTETAVHECSSLSIDSMQFCNKVDTNSDGDS